MVNIEGARQVTWSTGVAAWGGRSGCKLATASVNDAPPNTADITENRVLQCSSPSSENIREGVNGESSSSKVTGISAFKSVVFAFFGASAHRGCRRAA